MKTLSLALLLAATSVFPAQAQDAERNAREMAGVQIAQRGDGQRGDGMRGGGWRGQGGGQSQSAPQSVPQAQPQAQSGQRGGWGGGRNWDRPAQSGSVAQQSQGGGRNWGRPAQDGSVAQQPQYGGRERGGRWNGGQAAPVTGGVVQQQSIPQSGSRQWGGRRDGLTTNPAPRTDWDRNNNGRVDRNWDRNRNGVVDRTWDRNRDGWSDNRRWDRGWRDNRSYDWRGYRNQYRNLYRAPSYYNPYGYGYGYQRFSIGFYLDSLFYSNRYWINDPWQYRLPSVYGAYRWVRYYDDVLLVDLRSGEVVDVIHSFFW